MICPGCRGAMETSTLEGHGGTRVELDACPACRAFWFDKYESLRLSPGATLALFQMIGDTPPRRSALSDNLHCPRCQARLLPTEDIQRHTRFRYWRCDRGHGRFITFFDFLREKDFIRPLSPEQIAQLRQQVQTVNCSNCGGPVDLTTGSTCPHCGSPLSMLDMEQAGRMVAALRDAAAPKPIDPALPVELARVRAETEAAFAKASGTGGLATDTWWRDASSRGLVEAALGVVSRWVKGNG